jgi:hypothetical protein
MDQNELESLTTAVLSRLAGKAHQPREGGIGAGSGITPPADLHHKDPAVARAARKGYCEALSNRGLEFASKAEREIYFAECTATLRDDGYFVD